MEYYSAMRNKMEPEDIMLTKISQAQKDKYLMSSLICTSKNCRFHVSSRVKCRSLEDMRSSGRKDRGKLLVGKSCNDSHRIWQL